WPVLSTTKPVTIGAMMPARLPMQFCRPIHLPAHLGPARVWPTAKMLGVLKPKNTPANSSATIEVVGPPTAQASMVAAPPTCAATAKVLRTVLSEAPAAIHRSDTQPVA